MKITINPVILISVFVSVIIIVLLANDWHPFVSIEIVSFSIVLTTTVFAYFFSVTPKVYYSTLFVFLPVTVFLDMQTNRYLSEVSALYIFFFLMFGILYEGLLKYKHKLK